MDVDCAGRIVVLLKSFLGRVSVYSWGKKERERVIRCSLGCAVWKNHQMLLLFSLLRLLEA